MNPTLENVQKNREADRKITPPGGMELPDSPQDAERLKPETATIQLPYVKNIPGQELIHPAPLGEIADTTTVPDDEEGVGIFKRRVSSTGTTNYANILVETVHY